MALAAVLGCGWVAAPALSSQPYVPEPVDFEQALPEAERSGRAEVGVARHHDGRAHRHGSRFVTPPLTAPERFDLVGLAGERRAVELRARETGGEWSDWIETANGDPVYFGGAEQVQLRTVGWRPAGTLHYVNVSGTTGAAGSVLSDVRRAVNSAYVSAAELVVPAAGAAPPRPAIVRRRSWDPSGSCTPRERPAYGKVKAAAVHHTVTSGTYSEAEAPGIVLGICRYHRNAHGWNDIGYNTLVDSYGNVYEGRDGGLRKPVIAAHAQGFNSQSTGVAAIGTHTDTSITPAAREGFVSYLAWKLSKHGLRARGKTRMTSAGGSQNRYPAGKRVRTKLIFGHEHVGLTTCPGEALDGQLRELRREVQARIDSSDQPPAPAPPGGGLLPR